MKTDTPRILITYTGGTIGMITNPETGAYRPFNFSNISSQIPALQRFGYQLDTISFESPIDSSDLKPEVWVKLVNILQKNYTKYNGFVILHGTDTMAYSASALSFMLKDFNKPIVLTGSQLPIETLRTDGKENLITSVEIAAATREDGSPQVPEVCVYFDNKLYRGNRVTKKNAEYFDAFESPNYPHLAEAGITIKYFEKNIKFPTYNNVPDAHTRLDSHIALLKLHPGMNPQIIESVFKTQNLKAVILETFGSGNAFGDEWFLNVLQESVNQGIVVVNVTQCLGGSVNMTKYDTGKKLLQAGVVSGYDITTEAAVTKLMYLLGLELSPGEVRQYFEESLAGEISR